MPNKFEQSVMLHEEFTPLPPLRSDIRCFWSFEISEASYNSGVLLPDPYIPLVINCGAPLVLELANGAQVELPPVIVGGLQAKPLRVRATGIVRHVAVCLYPWALHGLGNPSERIGGGSMVALHGVWNDLAQTIRSIVRTRGYAEAVACLQEFVSDIYRPTATLAPVRAAGTMLFASQGRLRMDEVAMRSYISPSQLDRSFKHFTGLSPKTLARLIRFNAIRDCLISDPSMRPLDLALNFGYSDQAHLIHEFKHFAACTPGAYADFVRTNAPA